MAVVVVKLLPVSVQRGLDPKEGAGAVFAGEACVAHEKFQILVRLLEAVLVEMLHVDHLDVLDHPLAVGELALAERTHKVVLSAFRVHTHILERQTDRQTDRRI